MNNFSKTMGKLEKIINQRFENKDSKSYTYKILTSGKAAQKFGEEAVETVIAATKKDKKEFIYESADMIFHWLVAAKEMDVNLEDISFELEQRIK